MMKKNTPKWLTAAVALGFAASTVAAPFSVRFADTASNAPGLGINAGEQFTVEFVLDNGNSSTASQTWTAANVQCAIFTFNNAQNLFVAINYAGSPFTTSTTGSFTTNGAGVLQTAPSGWIDFSNPVVAPVVTNIVGATPVRGWFINAANNVFFFAGSSVGFTNVANDTAAASWSNPVPGSGACSGIFTPLATSQAIPTLTQWGVVMLSGLLALGGVFSLRRRRQ